MIVGNARVQFGKELDHTTTTEEERELILAREQRLRSWRRSLPKKKKQPHTLPGKVQRTIIGPTI